MNTPVPEKFVTDIASDLKSSKNENENESSEGCFYESQNTGEFSAVRKRIGKVSIKHAIFILFIT